MEKKAIKIDCGKNSRLTRDGRNCQCLPHYFETDNGQCISKIQFLDVSDLLKLSFLGPCDSNPCLEDAYCLSLSTQDYNCMYSEGELPCFFNGSRIIHGKTKNGMKCNNGNIEQIFQSCQVEGISILHSSLLRMTDQIIRQCDDGHMKLPYCKNWCQKFPNFIFDFV